MHKWSTEEAFSLKDLLSFSEHPYLKYQNNPLCLPATISGWTAVRPNAIYDIEHIPVKKRRQHRPSIHGLPFNPVKKSENHNAMSGKLNQDYSYVYTRGLSSRASSNEASTMYHMSPPTNSTYQTQTINLAAALPYRQMDTRSHMDISKLLAAQTKPELLVEQIIIENRLRTLSLSAFPSLDLEGIGVGQSSTVPTKSSSTPLLMQQVQYQQQSLHRQTKRRKKRTHGQGTLVWCPLSSPDKQEEGRDILRDACLLPATLPFDGNGTREHMQLSGLTVDANSMVTAVAGHASTMASSNEKKQSQQRDVRGKWTGDKIVYIDNKLSNRRQERNLAFQYPL